MVLHATSLHHARCRDDDTRLFCGVQRLRLVDVADEGETIESEGVGGVFDDVFHIVVEEVDVHTEDLGGVDGQGTVDVYGYLLG